MEPENWWRGLQEAVQELRDRKVGQPLAFEFLRRMEEHAIADPSAGGL